MNCKLFHVDYISSAEPFFVPVLRTCLLDQHPHRLREPLQYLPTPRYLYLHINHNIPTCRQTKHPPSRYGQHHYRSGELEQVLLRMPKRCREKLPSRLIDSSNYHYSQELHPRSRHPAVDVIHGAYSSTTISIELYPIPDPRTPNHQFRSYSRHAPRRPYTAISTS
jgi:hypothetical protein